MDIIQTWRGWDRMRKRYFPVRSISYDKKGILVSITLQPGLHAVRICGKDVDLEMCTGRMLKGVMLYQGDIVTDRHNKNWASVVGYSPSVLRWTLDPPHPVDENSLDELLTEDRLRIVGNVRTHEIADIGSGERVSVVREKK